MASRTSRARTRRDFDRPASQRSGQRVLIVCEGKVTEPGYIAELRKQLKLGGVVVIVHDKSAPSKVVEKAQVEQKKAKRKGSDFDAVWCVFDRDPGHQDFDRAVELAKKHKFNLAISVPCFEIWLLLHYCYTTRSFCNAQDVIGELCKYCPDFSTKSKKTDWSNLLEAREKAAIHAEKLQEWAEQSGSGTYSNPSTQMHKLVGFLERLKP